MLYMPSLVVHCQCESAQQPVNCTLNILENQVLERLEIAFVFFLPSFPPPLSCFSFSSSLVTCVFLLNFNVWYRDDENIVRKFLEKQKEFRYKRALEGRRMLPAWNCKGVILDTVEQHQVVVICGETGCGKSTQVRLA